MHYPDDYYNTIFAPAYAAGARIHTNSWGAADGEYDFNTRSVDEYM